MEVAVRMVDMVGAAIIVLMLLAPASSAANADAQTEVEVVTNGCRYNRTMALILVEYASAVYIEDELALLSWSCSRCEGLTKGFKIHTLVVDVQHCLQAFVGVAENLNAIVIAFRGTQESSMQNWAEDLLFKQLDLNYPGVTDAMVHQGFYSAYHNTTVRDSILTAVQSIQQGRDGLHFLLTGHSMGGAMASFCALDLAANYGVQNIEIITFGQPRIGNSVFAAYYNELVPWTIRMTHANDLVPHLPPYYTLLGPRSYHHFATEVWIFKIVVGPLQYEFERVCDSSGEDPTCSRSVKGNSISDHLNYLGVYLRTEDNVMAIGSDFLKGKSLFNSNLDVPGKPRKAMKGSLL